MKIICWLFAVSLLSLPLTSQAGRVILTADEWATSNQGFNVSPTAINYVQNIADLFADGNAGRFHAYSNNFSLTQSAMANALTSAGHSWSTGTSITFDLATLQTYDGVFFAGNSGDTNILADYINSGGNAYIIGGTTSAAASTANYWNPLLSQYGLGFGSNINIGTVNDPITSTHSIFADVNTLYQVGGQEVFDLDATNPLSQVLEFDSSGRGLYALYDSTVVPIPAAAWLFVFAFSGLMGIAKRRSYIQRD